MTKPDIAVRRAGGDWDAALPGAEAIGRRVARAAVGTLDDPAVEVCLVLADDATVRDLNRAYRGLDRPTNVLSFAGLDADQAPGAPRLLGDVVIALETARRESAEVGRSLTDHFSHLVVHGMLHLLGHDHATESEAQQMEDLEARVLGRLGIADPRAGRGEPVP